MKATKIFQVLGLALIFASSTTLFAGNPVTKGTPNTSIRYAVNVQYSGPEIQLLATYLIKIYNEKHQQVSPPQNLIPGKMQYTFFERGPADGIRIAVIEKAIIDGGSEPWWSFVVEPAIVKGPFEIGQTYRFDLFPKLTGGQKE